MLRIVGLIAVVLLPSLAQGESLLDAYRLARENDPKFRGAQFDNKASGTAIDQARAGFLPTMKFDVEHTDSRQRIISSNNPIFGAGISKFPTDNQTLYLTQPIFRKDVIERFGQAKAVVKQAEYTLLAAEQDLQLRTTTAYLTVLAANDALELAQAERQAIGKALELASEKLKGGLGTITGKYDAASRYAVTEARVIEAENRVRDARQGLREVTGRLIENVQALRGEYSLEIPQPAVIERWVEVALQQNLMLLAKQEGVEIASQEVERQRAGHYPSLDLLFTHNRKDAGSTLYGGGSNVETTDLMVRLSVPIFSGGLTSAVTQEAAYRFQKSKEDLEQERRAVERATRAAYHGTLSGVSLVRALRQSVESQEQGLLAKQEGYRAGVYPLLPVLDAQRDLYFTKRDYYQSRYDYLVNRLKLKQAAGTLSEADLEGISAALQ